MGVTRISILWCSSSMLTCIERWKALKVWITETGVSVGQEVPTVKFWRRIICALFHFLYGVNPFCLSWNKLNNNHQVIMQCISYNVCLKMIPYISTFVDLISQLFFLACCCFWQPFPYLFKLPSNLVCYRVSRTGSYWTGSLFHSKKH